MNSFVYSHNGYDQLPCHINGLRSERIFKQLAQTDTIALLEIIGTNNTNRMEGKGGNYILVGQHKCPPCSISRSTLQKGKGEGRCTISMPFLRDNSITNRSPV